MNFRQKVITAIVIITATLVGMMFSISLLQSQNLAIALLIVAICLVMILIEPFIGLLNYLMFLYIRPQAYIEAFRNIPLIFIIGGVTLFIMFIKMAISQKPFNRAPQTLYLFWFFVAIILSQMAQFYIAGMIQSAMDFLSILFMYLLIANMVDSDKKLNITYVTLILLSLYLAIGGIIQYHTGTAFGGRTMIEGRIRSIGIFGDPNDLALTFLIVMPFLLLRIIKKGNYLLKLLLILLFLVFLYAIYLTNSRGGMLALGAMFGVLFVRRYGIKVGAALSLVALAGMVALGPSRMMDLSMRESSAAGRVEAWAAGLSMLKSSPIFGVGIGNYTDYHRLVAHNSFMHCAGELGLFGLYPWVMMIFLSVKNSYSLIRFKEMDGDLQATGSWMVLLGFVVFIVAGTFLSRTYNELLYILIGLSAADVNNYVNNSSERFLLIEKQDYLNVAYIIIGTLFLAQIFLIWYW